MKKVATHIIVGAISFIIGFFAKSIIAGVVVFFKPKLESRGVDVEISQVTQMEMERGFVYTGGIRNGHRFGPGRMTTPKGSIYEGEWVDNEIISGMMITRDAEYDGEFKKLSPDGYGTMKYRDGSFYRGMWQDGAKSGIGLFVDSIGRKKFGLWKKGLIEKKTENLYVDKACFGIDISHHNSINDWGNMALFAKRNGLVYTTNPPAGDYYFLPIDFVILKATEGATHRDKDYLSNMNKAKKYHKKRGAYHFMHLTSSSVEEQVDNFLDYIVYEEGDLPPVLDVEVVSQAEAIGINATRQKVLMWLGLVEEKMGVKPIIYTSANMKKDYFSSDEFAEYDFWIAHYKDSEPDFKDYKMWQFTNKGKLYGNNLGNFDVNIKTF